VPRAIKRRLAANCEWMRSNNKSTRAISCTKAARVHLSSMQTADEAAAALCTQFAIYLRRVCTEECIWNAASKLSRIPLVCAHIFGLELLCCETRAEIENYARAISFERTHTLLKPYTLKKTCPVKLLS